jgi:lipopolysaccharide biosynthesis regulator YciM
MPLSELGQDYLKAGLLDRAEDIFLKLRGTDRDEEALKNLLEIYQQEKEWAKAIAIAEAMPNHSDHLWQKEIAEFRCEMAANEMLHDRHDEARRLLEDALAANRKCVRATLLLGELALKVGAGETAIDHWKSIEQQNPVYLSLAAEKLMAAHIQRVARSRATSCCAAGWSAILARSARRGVSCGARQRRRGGGLCTGARRTAAQSDAAGARQAAGSADPGGPARKRPDLELIKNLIHNHTRRVARYRCDACGFKARQFYWRCPGCGGWETYPPRRTEEFDITL